MSSKKWNEFGLDDLDKVQQDIMNGIATDTSGNITPEYWSQLLRSGCDDIFDILGDAINNPEQVLGAGGMYYVY